MNGVIQEPTERSISRLEQVVPKSMETCNPAAHNHLVNKLIVSPEHLADQLPSSSHDECRYKISSLQRIRSTASTWIESEDSVPGSSVATTSRTASVLTSISAHRTVAKAMKKFKALEAKRTSLTSDILERARTKANNLSQHKRMRAEKTKLEHVRYNYTACSCSTPAGNVINFEHEQYALTYGMMCGIRASAGLQKPFKQRLTVNDFMRVDKKIFRANARLEHGCKFKDYSPDVFCQVRRRFGIDLADYMLTLSGDFGFIEFMSNSKSGQFFFYSHDGRFMIKTQTKDDSKFLRRILPHYYQFVMENPNTLITRFYGLHRVQMHHMGRKVHFVIMASVFDTSLEIHARFDLKGSRIGRHASTEEYERGSQCVLKDNDLLDKGFRLQMSVAQRAIFLAQLRTDVDFLKRMKIMDYSILIGVHDSAYDVHNNMFAGTQTSNSFKRITAQQEAGCRSLSTPSAVFERKCVQVRPFRAVSMPDEDFVNQQLPSTVSSIADSQAQLALSLPDIFTWNDSCANSDLVDSENKSELNGFASSEEGRGRSFSAASDKRSLSVNRHCAKSLPSMPKHAANTPPLSSRLFDTIPGVKIANSFFCKDEGGIYGRDRYGYKNGCVYFLGIIDILQQYNTRKIAETLYKGLHHNRKHISAVEPEFYGKRFMENIEKHVV